jgi:stage II sporulation protein D
MLLIAVFFGSGLCAASAETVVVRIADRLTAATIGHDGMEERLAARSPLPRRFLSSDPPLLFNHRSWRGELLVERSSQGGISVLNRLPLEDYLKGVVPCEMPATWPIEALKAQAVAARSYALGRLRRRSPGFPSAALQATVSDQVYRGASAETGSSNLAVEATRGEYLEYAGEPLTAYFHAACGGAAERPADVWRSASAEDRWLAASAEAFANDPDTWCAGSPHQSWRHALGIGNLEAALRGLTPIRRLEHIEIRERSLSGRAVVFAVTGRNAEGRRTTRLVDGQRLKSLQLDLFRDGERYVFFGRGWGHGVGLCQWGARARAEAGATYREILAAYYPGARLARMDGAPEPALDPAAPRPIVETVAYPPAP